MFSVLFSLQILALARAQWHLDYEPSLDAVRCQTPDLNLGLCIPVNHCHSMIDFLKQFSKPFTSEVETFLDQYTCGKTEETPRVCCPQSSIVFRSEDSTTVTLPDVSNHKNLQLLPPICGKTAFSSKITHGNTTGIFEFPWMAIISYMTRYGPQFQCGGTILNDKYILTAAHCLTRLKFPLHNVRVGDHNWETDNDCEDTSKGSVCAPPYQDLEIEEAIPHESYNHVTSQNDIGLLRVSQINLTPENSKPVCLPLAEARTYDFTDKEGIVAGWGITEHGAPSTELLKVTLPIVSDVVCQSKYGTSAILDYRQICAGGVDNRDSCGGDSGGPLFVNGTIEGKSKLVQQGVVSFGPTKCGEVRVPGVYTRVAVFMDWILDNLKP